jgi:RNA polymerase sigma-70 factor (ECF subfamily)
MNQLAERRAQRLLMQQLPDTELARRVLNGEPALFELIMRRYNRRMFRIARGILGNDADAEDAMQEAYVSAYFKLGQFRGPSGFASWLCQIMTNQALMHRRSRLHVAPVAIAAAEQVPSEEVATIETKSIQDNPEADLHEQQLRRLLEQAIDALPDVYRTAFVFRELEQMSVAETAECLGIEAATVKTRVHRARRLLQRGLTAELSTLLTDAFSFDGARCDRVVERVIARINLRAAPRR